MGNRGVLAVLAIVALGLCGAAALQQGLTVTGFRMPTGAAQGYVLTCDADGVGLWQPAPAVGSNDSDWVVLGTDLYPAVSGNVGIGTTTPEAKLEVNGDVKITGAVRGDLGPGNGAPFPRPAFDSGWLALAFDQQRVVNHGLGGDVGKYVVNSLVSTPGSGIELDDVWEGLTSQSITIYNDWGGAVSVRVRIWVIQ